MKKKKVALLCHTKGNIGHQFMAMGIQEIIEDIFGEHLEIDYFEQHKTFQVFTKYNPLRLFNKLPFDSSFRFIRKVFNTQNFKNWNYPNLLQLNYDMAIACGGPNILNRGSYDPILGNLLGFTNGAFIYRNVPFCDAGVGSCFPLENLPTKFEDLNDRKFYKEVFSKIDKLIVRDQIAKDFVEDLGINCKLLPCAAIASGRFFESKKLEKDSKEKYIAINFQKYGANSNWDQNIDSEKWLKTMRDVIKLLEKDHKLILLAHSPTEFELAKDLAPHIERIFPTNKFEYKNLISKVKLGLVSRIHAAIPFAGSGIPSVVIGTDTRIHTLDLFGLPTSFVKTTNSEWIIANLNNLLNNLNAEKERLIDLRENTIRSYAEIFSNL